MSDNRFSEGQAPLGLQIRALRKERGWTLAELARRAETSAPTLHRYESGWERFEIATLRKLAKALGARLNVSLEAPHRVQPASMPTKEEMGRLLEPLFWDTALRTNTFDTYRDWVLRRVLMYGDRQQVEASRRFFGDEALRAAVAHREVDERTRNYWRLILEEDSHDSESPQP